jgi:hypothetical protein
MEPCLYEMMARIVDLPDLKVFAVVSEEDDNYGVLMYKHLCKCGTKLHTFHFCGWNTCVTWLWPGRKTEKAVWGRAQNDVYHFFKYVNARFF